MLVVNMDILINFGPRYCGRKKDREKHKNEYRILKRYLHVEEAYAHIGSVFTQVSPHVTSATLLQGGLAYQPYFWRVSLN